MAHSQGIELIELLLVFLTISEILPGGGGSRLNGEAVTHLSHMGLANVIEEGCRVVSLIEKVVVWNVARLLQG